MDQACASCGQPAGPCRLCHACVAARLADERVAAGLPPTVEDPVGLARIAEIVNPRRAQRPA